MTKPFIQILLAAATLAVLNSLTTFGQSYQHDSYPTDLRRETRLDAAPQSPIRANTASNEIPVPTGQATSDTPPLVDNGWEQAPVALCDQAPSCNMNKQACSRRYIVDVELMALRTHFSEDPLGKLGEHYELSERITLGVEKPNGLGGRIRFWSYDRTMPNLQGGSDLGADFTVTDFEGTTHFGNQAFDLEVAGGIRFADIRLDTDTGHVRSNQMPGATFALDIRSLICRNEAHGLEWHSVGGARWSILGGDWRSDDGIIAETRDDNVTVMEIYGGFECSYCCRGHEMYSRLVFEAQNWRSDALGENTGIDSIGFVGPGLNLGVNY